jgi:hypothetical protein
MLLWVLGQKMASDIPMFTDCQLGILFFSLKKWIYLIVCFAKNIILMFLAD